MTGELLTIYIPKYETHSRVYLDSLCACNTCIQSRCKIDPLDSAYDPTQNPRWVGECRTGEVTKFKMKCGRTCLVLVVANPSD